MADHNVIDPISFGSSATAGNADSPANAVREPEPPYAVNGACEEPSLPPAFTRLDSTDASHNYRAALGIVGLAHMLRRSQTMRDTLQSLERIDAADIPGADLHESRIWYALIELGEQLADSGEEPQGGTES